MPPRGANYRCRHSRELCDLKAIALVGGPFLDAVQKYDVILVLDGVEMHVRELPELVREPRELEIMSGE